MAPASEWFAWASTAVGRAVTSVWFPRFVTVLGGIACYWGALQRARQRHLELWCAQALTGVPPCSPGEKTAQSALGPRFQFRLWCLVVLVAACALVFGMDRYIHDQFSPGNAPARG